MGNEQSRSGGFAVLSGDLLPDAGGHASNLALRRHKSCPSATDARFIRLAGYVVSAKSGPERDLQEWLPVFRNDHAQAPKPTAGVVQW
jgi:hypothetical protein